MLIIIIYYEIGYFEKQYAYNKIYSSNPSFFSGLKQYCKTVERYAMIC